MTKKFYPVSYRFFQFIDELLHYTGDFGDNCNTISKNGWASGRFIFSAPVSVYGDFTTSLFFLSVRLKKI